MDGFDYINIAAGTMKKAYETQRDTFAAVSERLAEAVETKHNIFVFGCSHAGILAEEVFYRTGEIRPCCVENLKGKTADARIRSLLALARRPR